MMFSREDGEIGSIVSIDKQCLKYGESSTNGCRGARTRFGIDLLVQHFKQSCVSSAILVLLIGSMLLLL